MESKQTKHLLSICIVSYNVKDYLAKCLKSIYTHLNQINFEVIVVDNNSLDHTQEMIANEFPQITLICNKDNKGFAVANNIAIKKATGSYILLLNPDTIVCNNSIEELIKYLKNNPDCAITGPKLLNEDASIQNGVRQFPSLVTTIARNSWLKHLSYFKHKIDQAHMRHFDLNKSSFVDQVSGAALLFSRNTFNKLGFLDERFFIFFEEVDYCKRAHNLGLNVFYNADSQIYHLGGKSRKQINFNIKLIHLESQLKYLKKHNTKTAYSLFIIFFKINYLITLFTEFIIDIILISVLFLLSLLIKTNPIIKKLQYRQSKFHFRSFFITKKLFKFIFIM